MGPAKQIAHFDRIAIVQSLSNDNSGEKLYEDINMINLAHDIGLDIKCFNVRTKEELLNLIAKLTNDVKMCGFYPILHIEAHGSADKKGLILAAGEFVNWEDLKKSLINLNIETKNNLLIVLAACHGAHLTQILSLTDRAPCWGLIGPVERITTEVLLRSFYSFYNELLTTGDGDSAIKLLNDAVPLGDKGYYFTTAEMMFEKVFKHYLATSCTKKALRERALKIFRNLKKDLKNMPNLGEIKHSLAKTDKFFKKYQRLFFMIDIYPENKKRFTISFRDILN